MTKPHPNAGRKHSAEHIAKRVAAVAAARSKWSSERRVEISRAFRDAQLRRAPAEKAATAARQAVSHSRRVNRPTTIYALRAPGATEVRYVGKTVGKVARRLAQHISKATNGGRSRILRWIGSLCARGETPDVVMLQVVAPGEDWVTAEQQWISHFRALGARLVNHCDGGQGTPGIVFTDEHRAKLRAAHLGRRPSAESLAKRSASLKAAWKERPTTRRKPGTLAKMLATKAERRAAGLYKKRRPATEETKARIRETKARNRALQAAAS